MMGPVQSNLDLQRRIDFGDGGMTIAHGLRMMDRGGRWHRLEMHPYMGPTFLTAAGDPRRIQPAAGHPVWKAFSLWLRQGQKIDAEMVCLWEDDPAEPAPAFPRPSTPPPPDRGRK